MGLCKQNKPYPPQVTSGYIVHHSSRETKPRQEVLVWSQGMRAASLTQALLGKVTQESKAREMNKVVWRLEWRSVHCKHQNLLQKVKVDANALRRGKRCLRTQRSGLTSPNIILSPILCLPTEQWFSNSHQPTIPQLSGASTVFTGLPHVSVCYIPEFNNYCHMAAKKQWKEFKQGDTMYPLKDTLRMKQILVYTVHSTQYPVQQ